MTKQKEALKLALMALENLYDTCDGYGDDGREAMLNAPKTIAAIKEALAQPEQEQEPVAWRTFDGEGGYDYRPYEDNESYADDWNKRNPNHVEWVDKLYTHPQRTWVGLTDEEIDAIYTGVRAVHREIDSDVFARAIERLLKEKNT